jgi:hypothetical protein
MEKASSLDSPPASAAPAARTNQRQLHLLLVSGGLRISYIPLKLNSGIKEIQEIQELRKFRKILEFWRGQRPHNVLS